jgi:phage-related protein
VESGAAEIRVSDPSGTYRAFHVIDTKYGILVFHAFTKKTKKTPDHEIKVGRKRLREFLEGLENEDE